MPFIDEFDSITVMRKRNSIYYGPTVSKKIASTLSEVEVDLNIVYEQMSRVRDSYSALASGFLSPSGYANSLFDLRREIYRLENLVEERIYTQAEQDGVFE